MLQSMGLQGVRHGLETEQQECKGSSQVVSVVRNPPANAGDIKDPGLIPGSGRCLEEGMGTHSSILA